MGTLLEDPPIHIKTFNQSKKVTREEKKCTLNIHGKTLMRGNIHRKVISF